MLCLFFVLLHFVLSLRAENSNCEKVASLAAMEDHKTVVATNLEMLEGTWISEGCEIRPGPEYVLRQYSFDANGRFFLIQHRYWDESCSSPQLSIFSNGRIILRDSLIQPGAASSMIKVTNITIVPQDANAAKELDRVVSMQCPGHNWKSWRQYVEHTVYDSRYDERKRVINLWSSYENSARMNHHSINSRNNGHFSDITCLGSLKWAFNELKLLKIQLRPILDETKRRSKTMIMELLLGDIHSNSRLREYYNPTSFQVPLVKQVKEETTVSINRHSYIIKYPNVMPMSIYSNGKTPPHLIAKPHLPPYIWGEWSSTRCETRSMALFLTRRFSFYSEDSTWIGEHQFYSDPYCKIPKFIVTAAGRFTLGEENIKLRGTTNINFHIERASLTALDRRIIYDMKLPGLCGTGEWAVKIPKELSTTNGCAPLGITLPSILTDIVKMEVDYRGSFLLFLGQIHTDSMQTESTERPTAFQLPLVKCGTVANYSQGLRDILNSKLYNNSAYYVRFSLLTHVLAILLWVLR